MSKPDIKINSYTATIHYNSQTLHVINCHKHILQLMSLHLYRTKNMCELMRKLTRSVYRKLKSKFFLEFILQFFFLNSHNKAITTDINMWNVSMVYYLNAMKGQECV